MKDPHWMSAWWLDTTDISGQYECTWTGCDRPTGDTNGKKRSSQSVELDEQRANIEGF